MKPSIIRLRALEKQLYAYLYAMTVIDFDAETVAPEGSADGRAEATEVLSRASFDLLVNDGTAALLKEAAADAETEQERAEVRNLQRQYDEIARIPADEYAAFTKLCSQSVPAWTKAKRTNDFSLFAPYLEKLIAARRAQARYFAPDRDPYEVLLDRYEKGLTIAQCDEFFSTLRETIVPLLADIQTRGKAVRTDFLDQEWPIDAQRRVSKKIMELWGLDPAHCYLAESEHPFTTEFWRGDVRVLDSAAFYNCRRLRRVTLGPGVEGFGSDLFTNCRQLQTFRLRAAADAPTGLKKLLGAVSADITVELDGAQLFYPEYSEFLDENTPAHIFNHSIEGEGYRMRQCFTPGGVVDYAAFDASFAQACVGESEDKLCRLALGRLVQPFGLGDDARADYELYLTAHPEAAFRRAIDDRDEAALRLLVGLSLPTADAAVYCARVGWSAGAAVLLGRAKRAKKTYDFDDL